MESQLLAEISLEKSNSQAQSAAAAASSSTFKTSSASISANNTNAEIAPADMLVSELFESFKAKSNKSTTGTLKANLRKVVKKPPSNPEEVLTNSNSAKANSQMVDFKSNLRKKSDPSNSSSTTFSAASSSKGEPLAEDTPIVDFKAKLRKSTKPDDTNSTKEDISS